MEKSNTKKQELIRANGNTVPVSSEIIQELKKYLRLMATICPIHGERIWFITGRS